MTKKKATSSEQLVTDLLKIHVPPDYLTWFDLYEVKNKPTCYELILHEKETQVPEAIRLENDVVLDGFCDSISILSQSFSLKRIYLVVKRRRWKRAGSDTHYSNSYDLHVTGAKLTHPMAAFLKECHRIFAH